MQDFLQSLMSGVAPNTPDATGWRSDFSLDKKGRIAFDPITGLPIKPKDRRSMKSFFENPNKVTPANALNANVPQWAGAMGSPQNSSALASIMNAVRGPQ